MKMSEGPKRMTLDERPIDEELDENDLEKQTNQVSIALM